MRVVVIGGAGRIGLPLAAVLADAGHEATFMYNCLKSRPITELGWDEIDGLCSQEH